MSHIKNSFLKINCDASKLLGKTQSLLKPFPDVLMDAHDVCTIVNSARYDGPECVEPVSDDPMPNTQLSLV